MSSLYYKPIKQNGTLKLKRNTNKSFWKEKQTNKKKETHRILKLQPNFRRFLRSSWLGRVGSPFAITLVVGLHEPFPNILWLRIYIKRINPKKPKFNFSTPKDKKQKLLSRKLTKDKNPTHHYETLRGKWEHKRNVAPVYRGKNNAWKISFNCQCPTLFFLFLSLPALEPVILTFV